MATHSDSVAGKKSNDVSNDLQIFNAENLQSNMKVIYYRFVLFCVRDGKLSDYVFCYSNEECEICVYPVRDGWRGQGDERSLKSASTYLRILNVGMGS